MPSPIHVLVLSVGLLLSCELTAQFTFESLPLPDGGGGVPYALVKAGNHLFKTGVNKIQYSDNNGLFWTACALPPNTWSCLPHVSAEGRLYTADDTHLFYSDNLGATWAMQDWPYAIEQRPTTIFTLSKDSFLVCSSTNVYKTVDGGLHWDNVLAFSDEPVADYLDLLAIPNSPVLLLRVPRFQVDVVYRSADKGQTWTEVLTVGSKQEGKLSRSEGGTLFLNGPQNAYWRSADKGLTWKPMKMGTDHLAEGLSIVSIGPAANKRVWGSMLGRLYLSENDGLSWTRTNLDLNNYGMGALRFAYHPEAGLFASKGLFEQGSLYRSADNGDSWAFASAGIKCGVFEELVFAAENEWVLSSTDGLFKTKDNGQNWALIFKTDPADAFCQLQKGKDQYLFVVWKNKLFYSPDGGLAWTERSFPMGLYNYSHFKVNPYDNTLYLFAQNKIVASTDFGATWLSFSPDYKIVDFYFYEDGSTEVQIFNALANKYQIYALKGDLSLGALTGTLPNGINTGFAPRMNVGYNGFRAIFAIGQHYFSNNHGLGWETRPSPFSGEIYPENAVVNTQNHIFLYDNDNNAPDKKFWYSLDKGVNWNDLKAPSLEYGPAKPRLSPGGRLYLLGYKGIFYRTTLSTTGLGPSIIETGGIDVFPNPFSTSFTFDCPETTLPLGTQFQLFDAFGKCWAAEMVKTTPFIYEADHLNNGPYFYKFLLPKSKRVLSGKLVKIGE